MNGKENPLELLVICAVMLVLSVLGIVGGLSRDLLGNLDGILMLGICLMMALIFATFVARAGQGTGLAWQTQTGRGSQPRPPRQSRSDPPDP